MRFNIQKTTLFYWGLFLTLILMGFQNCSKGGFQTETRYDLSSLQSSSSLAKEVPLQSIQNDVEEASFFNLNAPAAEKVFFQYQIYRSTDATLPDGQYLSWIISMGIYQIPSSIPSSQFQTEYELRILDNQGLPICPMQTGTFFGVGFTLKSACSALNVNRKVTFSLNYRLQGQSWVLKTWTEP